MLKRLFIYIPGAINMLICFPATNSIDVIAKRGEFDADWGGDKDNSRSTSGYLISVNSTPFYWKSKHQIIVTHTNTLSLSSGEKETYHFSYWSRRMLDSTYFLENNETTAVE